MSAYGKTPLEQAVVNARKVARNVIRLKHSIAADNELNDVMPILENRLSEMLTNGYIPELSASDIERMVNEEPS